MAEMMHTSRGNQSIHYIYTVGVGVGRDGNVLFGEAIQATRAEPENPPFHTQTTNVMSSPPGYGEAISREPPPSYETLYGRVKAAKESSNGVLDFLVSFITIILSTIGVTILIGIFMVLPVSMIVMGAIYIDDCEADFLLPIFLIGTGSFFCAECALVLCMSCCKSEEQVEDSKNCKRLQTWICTLGLASFIGECVTVYSIRDVFTSDDPDQSDYCNYTLYLYSYWTITSFFIIIGASCLCLCCVGCLAGCFGKEEE